MGNFFPVLLKPPGDNMCPVDRNVVMLHHGMQFIAEDGHVACGINPAFS